MALTVTSGSFTTRTTTGSQNYAHGLGVTPKLIMFFYSTTANGAHQLNGMSAAVSTTSRWCVHSFHNDNATAAQNTCGYWNDKVITITTTSQTTRIQADITGLDSTNFTLNYTTVNATTRRIHWVAYAGDELTVELGTMTANTSTGNQSVTGLANQPKGVIFATNTKTVTGNQYGGRFALGAMQSSTSRWALSSYGNDGVDPTQEKNYQLTSKALCFYGVSSVEFEADCVSLNSDGFTINWTTAPSGAILIPFISFSGSSLGFSLGSFSQATSTGNQSTTGTGFSPAVMRYFSVGKVADSGGTAHSGMGQGVGISSTDRRSMDSYGEDAAATTVTACALSETKCITIASGGTPTVDAAADFVSQDSNGFTVNWTTADATARQLLWWALGVASSGAVLQGDAAAVSTATGALTTGIPVAGAAVIVSSATGNITSAIMLAASASMISSASADTTTGIKLAASAAGQAAGSGTLTTGIPLQGAASAESSAGADATTGIPLQGAASAESSASADATTGIPLQGAAAAVSSASADATTGIPLQGAAAASASASADLGTPIQLDAAAAINAAGTATLTTGIPLQGAASAVSSASADATTGINLNATATISAAASGAITAAIKLNAAAIIEAAATAGMDAAILLAAAAAASASASADLGAPIQLDAAAAINAAGTAALTIEIRLNGAAVAQALASADATTGIPLQGAASAVSSAGAAMTTGIPLHGAAASVSAASGNLSTIIPLEAAAATIIAGQGSLNTSITLRGDAIISALGGGILTAYIKLDAAALAEAAATGLLTSDNYKPAPLRALYAEPEIRAMFAAAESRALYAETEIRALYAQQVSRALYAEKEVRALYGRAS